MDLAWRPTWTALYCRLHQRQSAPRTDYLIIGAAAKLHPVVERFSRTGCINCYILVCSRSQGKAICTNNTPDYKLLIGFQKLPDRLLNHILRIVGALLH